MGSKDSQGEAIVHLLFILVVGAAIGFVIFDGATKVDAVYLALSTVTTVGFGDVYPKSPAAKLLSICIQISGVGLCSHAVVHFGNWHVRILGKRPTINSCALILSVVATAGAFLLMLVEGMSIGDAIYLALVASTSVGYGDLTPVTSAGKFGCMLFVLVSLAPMAAVSGAVADALLSALGGNPLAGDEDLPPSSTSSAKKPRKEMQDPPSSTSESQMLLPPESTSRRSERRSERRSSGEVRQRRRRHRSTRRRSDSESSREIKASTEEGTGWLSGCLPQRC